MVNDVWKEILLCERKLGKEEEEKVIKGEGTSESGKDREREEREVA